MLGEFFAARENEIDEQVLEATFEYLETVTAGSEDSGWYRLPRTFRDGLAAVADVDSAARRWVATEELRLDEWQFEDGERVLREVSTLARHARDQDRDLWYWWSL